ncbi:MAG: exonuclease domain-containing protein [Erysipelotrichaceae bacterium]|nr:3'-5' exonuclease [Solobacterium sp.]MDY3794098.1 exonuclease domain-containing protein [Erysipelotrichaceae bacterium]
MAKCLICGKKGLFLYVDSLGRCKECAKKESEAEFNAFYEQILRFYNEVREDIDIKSDPFEAYEQIPFIVNKVKKCDELVNKIVDQRYITKLIKRFNENLEYDDKDFKSLGIGKLKDWDISVYREYGKNTFTQDDFISAISKKIYSYKNFWLRKIESIKENIEFQNRIKNLNTFEITLTDAKHKILSVLDLEENVKYTSITPKTSFDRIGSFVVVDIETTGLSCSNSKIVEVGAIKFEDWAPVEKFHTLINPGKHIPDDATKVNNITDEMVANSPTFVEIIDSLDSFVGKSNIVGHNLAFDLKFLYHFGYDFTSCKRKYYDTLEIAQRTLKKPRMKWDKEWEEYTINDNYDYDVENYKLTTLCDYYKIIDDTFAHRALSDAFATGLLFMNLVKDKTKL